LEDLGVDGKIILK